MSYVENPLNYSRDNLPNTGESNIQQISGRKNMLSEGNESKVTIIEKLAA